MWQSVNEFAWHDDLALLAIADAAVGLLMVHYKPAERRSILATLLSRIRNYFGLNPA